MSDKPDYGTHSTGLRRTKPQPPPLSTEERLHNAIMALTAAQDEADELREIIDTMHTENATLRAQRDEALAAARGMADIVYNTELLEQDDMWFTRELRARIAENVEREAAKWASEDEKEANEEFPVCDFCGVRHEPGRVLDLP